MFVYIISIWLQTDLFLKNRINWIKRILFFSVFEWLAKFTTRHGQIFQFKTRCVWISLNPTTIVGFVIHLFARRHFLRIITMISDNFIERNRIIGAPFKKKKKTFAIERHIGHTLVGIILHCCYHIARKQIGKTSI